MRESSLFIFEPPYASVRRLHDLEPALGAILLLDATDGTPTSNEVKAEMERLPWCPLCLLAAPASGVRSTRRLPRTCVVFGGESEIGAEILRAIADRPRPTSSDLVEWLARRTRRPSLGRVLSELFSGPRLHSRESSAGLTYGMRETMRQLGEWGALEWQRAAALAQLAADRTSLVRHLASPDAPGRELRQEMRDLLGLSERDFLQRHGWEWVLEAALRRSGYSERHGRSVQPLRSSSDAVPSRFGVARASA